ncbi:hypothetical protein F5Y19DRAFT_477942 [Xylariaceae sp. FL1651]|nr:hypothetical protein F5Y19DRAFT_477942 [Xylariaceae sp. FL1651]
MSSPNQTDVARLAPPSHSKAHPRNPQNVTQEILTIEPTVEYQRFYNQNRREMDRLRLEIHVAEENNLAPPPQAVPMSRSTTSESLPSPSTVHSHACSGDPPLSPDPTTEVARSKPHRGRRKGPLDIEKRTKTAFKRKFKLTCAFHRAKKTGCNCHDFSKLEEGYQRSVAIDTARKQRTRSQSANGNDLSRTSYGDIGTFGTGGAAPTTPSYRDFDLHELPSAVQSATPMRASVQPILRFNIDSEDSVNEMVSAPVEQPYFLGTSAPRDKLTQEASYLVTIGSQMNFPNRWSCEYQSTEDNGSLASGDACSWTGPFKQLSLHFQTEHHPFREADEPRWSMCAKCGTISPGWDDAPGCIAAGTCSQDLWKKWYYGTATHQSSLGPQPLTVSEISGSAYSGLQDPPWSAAGSSGTDLCHHPYSHAFSKSGFYEHSNHGKENIEAAENKQSGNEDYRPNKIHSRYQSHGKAARRIRRYRLTSGISTRNRDTKPGSALRRPPLSLPCRTSRPHWHLALSLLAHLAYFLPKKNRLGSFRNALLVLVVHICYLALWSLILLGLGALAAWILMDSLRIGRIEQEEQSHIPRHDIPLKPLSLTF